MHRVEHRAVGIILSGYSGELQGQGGEGQCLTSAGSSSVLLLGHLHPGIRAVSEPEVPLRHQSGVRLLSRCVHASDHAHRHSHHRIAQAWPPRPPPATQQVRQAQQPDVNELRTAWRDRRWGPGPGTAPSPARSCRCFRNFPRGGLGKERGRGVRVTCVWPLGLY